MLDVTVKVQAPELANALLALATAMNATSLIAPIQTGAETIAPPAQLQPPVSPAPVPTTPPPAPVAPPAPPVQAQPPIAPPVSVQPPVTPPPAVPTAAAPSYNRDQIMTAGAALIDAGKINELMGLLGAFGVQAVTQLKQEQLGAFATELRKLGAQL